MLLILQNQRSIIQSSLVYVNYDQTPMLGHLDIPSGDTYTSQRTSHEESRIFCIQIRYIQRRDSNQETGGGSSAMSSTLEQKSSSQSTEQTFTNYVERYFLFVILSMNIYPVSL